MNRILIVEDEIAIHDLIKIGLETQGYQCEEVADGEMADADLLRLKKCDEQTTIKALNYIFSEAKRLEELSYKLLALMEVSEDKLEFQKVKIKEFVEKVTKLVV